MLEKFAPRVSVIIPVYNGEATVSQAIDSALAQDFASTEILVVDDGSTDQTPRLLDRYASRIRRLRQDNRGASAARNAAAAVARGKFLAFLDADDSWVADKVTRTISALECNRNAGLAFSDFRRLALDGTELEPCVFNRAPSMSDVLARWSEILPSTVVMRRSTFEACGGFVEEFRPNYYEDYWMWLLAREQGEFEYVPGLLATIRIRETRPDGYFRNAQTFVRMVRKRYGHRGLGIVRETYKHLAGMAMYNALQRMDDSDRAGALKWWMRAISLRPTMIFDPQIHGRVLRIRNFRRITGMFRISKRARSAASESR